MQNLSLKQNIYCGFAILISYAVGFYTPALLQKVSRSQASTNSNIFTPESVLATGVDSATSVNPYTGQSGEARKDTIAATLNNVVLLNKIMAGKDTEQNPGQYKQIIEVIQKLITPLNAIGMFHFFTVEEWLAADNQPGRQLVGLLYLQNYKEELTQARKDLIKKIQKTTKSTLLLDMIKKTL